MVMNNLYRKGKIFTELKFKYHKKVNEPITIYVTDKIHKITFLQHKNENISIQFIHRTLFSIMNDYDKYFEKIRGRKVKSNEGQFFIVF